MNTNVVDFLGYPLYTGRLKDIDFENLKVIDTINPHCYYCACFDQKYSTALKNSDLLVPDGEGIVLGAKIEGIRISERITGSDLHAILLKILNERRGRVFYMGSTEDTLKKIQARLAFEYPNLVAGFHSPSYRKEFDETENREIVATINAFDPDVLFVGMTAPKQEKWVYDNADKIWARLIVSVGAVFDFYAGTVRRPGKIWISLHLEWFRRLIAQPGRLWRRTFISSPFFLWHVVLARLKAQPAWHPSLNPEVLAGTQLKIDPIPQVVGRRSLTISHRQQAAVNRSLTISHRQQAPGSRALTISHRQQTAGSRSLTISHRPQAAGPRTLATDRRLRTRDRRPQTIDRRRLIIDLSPQTASRMLRIIVPRSQPKVPRNADHLPRTTTL